jgi:hypothetical protein
MGVRDVDLAVKEVPFNRETLDAEVKDWIEAVEKTKKTADSIANVEIKGLGIKYYPPCYLYSKEVEEVETKSKVHYEHLKEGLTLCSENVLEEYQTLFKTAKCFDFVFTVSVVDKDPSEAPICRTWVWKKR